MPDNSVSGCFGLNRATPCGSRSTSVGKKKLLSPPSKMEISPQWYEVEVPVNDLNLERTEKENPEPLLRSSSMAKSFRIFPCNFNLISVVRSLLSLYSLEEVPLGVHGRWKSSEG